MTTKKIDTFKEEKIITMELKGLIYQRLREGKELSKNEKELIDLE